MRHTCEILHTRFFNNREIVRFNKWQIEVLAIPVLLNSAKHMHETFSAYFINCIKWSSTNYDLGATFANKPAAMDLATEPQELTPLASGNSIGQILSAVALSPLTVRQSVYSGRLRMLMCLCRALSTCAQQLCTNCCIYN